MNTRVVRPIAVSLPWLLIVALAPCAGAQAQTIEIRAAAEHRMTNGDTPESGRELALVEARSKAWAAAVERLANRADVKALKLTRSQLEAFTAVIVAVQEQAAQTPARSAQRSVESRVRAEVDPAAAVRRMTALRKDQDAIYDLALLWAGMQQMERELAALTQRRAGMTAEEAAPIVQDQLQTIARLDARHMSARAVAALARTEESAVGGRGPTEAGREESLQLARAALALVPDSGDAHEVMGDLLMDALEPEEAEAAFRKALDVDAASSKRRTKLAEALRLQGRFDEAVSELREAVRLEPGSARAHSGLGLALRAQKDMAGAIAAYKEAIRLDPDLIDAHNGLAVALANQGQLEAAVAEFREIIRIDPDSAIGYYNLAYALADLDRDVESAAALREVIRINPDHYNARYNLGELFRLEGKYDDSVRQFREYLRLAPDLPQNRRNIERAKGFIEKFDEQ